jgi:hypothetical protein
MVWYSLVWYGMVPVVWHLAVGSCTYFFFFFGSLFFETTIPTNQTDRDVCAHKWLVLKMVLLPHRFGRLKNSENKGSTQNRNAMRARETNKQCDEKDLRAFVITFIAMK